MGNLTHLTLSKILSGLTQTASNCPPNPTCKRYATLKKNDGTTIKN